MTDINLRILMSAVQGNTLSTISSVQRALGKDGLQGALLGVGVAAAGLAIGIGVKAVEAAAEYQSAMTQLQNTTGSSDAQMKGYTATIRELSDETGVMQTNLEKGMYQIISANFAGADATKILTTATEDAIIAHEDQKKVTTGLVVELNAFGLKANQVDTISNQMFKTLSLGRGQMGDLASALQTGAALVAHYGVSVTDMDATLATLSTGGMKTFGTSMTGLTQLLNVMDGKTDLITKRLHALGIRFDEDKFKAMTYTQQVAYLNEAFKGHEKQMVAVLGSKQAAVALGILATQSTLLASNLRKLGDAQDLAKQKQDAWTKVQGDFNFQWQKFQTNMQNLLIDLGMKLLPILTPIVKTFSDWATGLQYSLVPAIGNFISWIQQGSAPVQALKGVLETIVGLVAVQKFAKMATDISSTALNMASLVTQGGAKLLSFLGADQLAGKLSNIANLLGGPGGVSDEAKAAGAALGEQGLAADANAAEKALGTAGAASGAGLAGAVAGLISTIGAIVGVALVEFEIAKFLKDNHILPDAPKKGLPDWITHQNASSHQASGGTNLKDAIPSPTSISIRRHAAGGVIAEPVVGFGMRSGQGYSFAENGPETVIPGVGRGGGGHTFIINVSTMAGSRSEVMRMVDLMEAEIASRFRGQTPSFGFGGVL